MAKGSNAFNQRRPRRRERSRILVVTEGVNTEVQYLEGLVQFLRLSGMAVRRVNTKGTGKDPAKVLAAAIKINEDDPDGYDEIWLVVDVDGHATLEGALSAAARCGIPMVVSNPCFEIWLLWHYQDCRSHKTAKQLAADLARHGHTGKGIPRNFPYVQHSEAVKRASGVDHSCRGPNPSSAMPSLLAALQRDG